MFHLLTDNRTGQVVTETNVLVPLAGGCESIVLSHAAFLETIEVEVVGTSVTCLFGLGVFVEFMTIRPVCRGCYVPAIHLFVGF